MDVYMYTCINILYICVYMYLYKYIDTPIQKETKVKKRYLLLEMEGYFIPLCIFFFF